MLVKDDDGKKNKVNANDVIQTMSALNGVNIQNQIGILKSYLLNDVVLSELDFGVSYHRHGRLHTVQKYLPDQLILIIDTAHFQKYNIPLNIKILSEKKYCLTVEYMGKTLQKIDTVMNFGETYENSDFKFTVYIRNPERFNDEKPGEYDVTINSHNALVNKYKNKLSIQQTDKESTILTLTTSGFTPDEVCDYLNKLTEVYIRYGLDRKNDVIKNTITFIDEQIASVVDSLDVTSDKLQDFRAKNMIVNITQEGQQLYSQYEKLNTQKAELLVEQKYYDYITKYLEDKQNTQSVIVPTAVGIRDQLLINFIMRLNTLNEEAMGLRAQSVKSNPRLDLIESQIDGLKLLISENVVNLSKTNNIAIKDIDERIDEVTLQIEKLPSNERKLMNINRKFNVNDQIYTYLLEKRAEAGLKQAANTPDAQVLDYARPDQAARIKPKTTTIYMASLMLGLAIPVIIIILVNFFNNRIRSREDVEKRTKTPIIGIVGHNPEDNDLVIFDNPRSVISESFRTIKTNVQYLVPDKESKTILVTSTFSGEGKSFCTSNLASVLAMTNKKTLLMGLDLRKPQIQKIFKMDNSVGISTYLIGKSTIDDIIVKTRFDNLWIILPGPVPPNPAQLIESEALSRLFEEAKKRFDYIIIDTPPIGLVADAMLLAKYADTNIFVLRQGYSFLNSIEIVNDLNKNKNVPDYNILLNDAKINGKYGYSGYGYGRRYGY
ncbi:MAG: polysaccharide biosynthesis tyrosine autokinase, partial [Salinivirgaceae bacterium]|nr:polysaccharide biosynthesis tyrosine autokinase [Salinivirgaceae bacterium]